MADGVIGSVKVRVRPDTTEFVDDLKDKFRTIEKDKSLALTFKNMEVDYKSLLGAARDTLKEVNKTLASNESMKVMYRAGISEVGMPRAVRNARNKLAALARAQAPIEFRATVSETALQGMRKQMRDLGNEFGDALDQRVQVGVDMDEVALRKARSEIDKLGSSLRKTDHSGTKLNKSLNGIASGFARFSGLRLGAGIGRDFRDFFANIDRQVPLIGGLTLAAEGLGSALLTAGANTFSLSRALAQIGPGALALPGIFGGIAIGLGSTVAVFKDFNKEIPGVGKALGEIQDLMSANFWDKARAPIQNLIDTLLPQLSVGLQKTGSALGLFFGNLAGSLTGQLDGALAGMFRDLNASIREFATHTDSIATIIRILGEAGAGRLPELAAWVGTLTDRFSSFLDTAQQTGFLDMWIDTAVDRIKSLGNVLKNAGMLFAGLARAADAATPGDALSNLADSLDRAQKAVNGSRFQAQLTGVLIAAHQAMENISSTAGPAFVAFWDTLAFTLKSTLPRSGEALGTLFKGIFEVLGSAPAQSGWMALVNGFAAGIENFAPAFDVLGEKIGAFATLIGQMGETFGSVLGAMVTHMAPVATAVATALTPLVGMLGGLVTGIIGDLAPVFAVVASNVAKVGAALAPMVSKLSELWNVVGPLLVPVLKVLAEIIGSAVVGAIQGLTLMLSGITQVITGVVDVFKGLWDVIAGIFTGDFSRIGDGFGQIFGGLKDIVVGALKAVAGAVWAWLNGSIFGIVRTGGVKLAAQFGKVFSKIGPIVSKTFEAIKTIVTTAWTVIRTIFSAGASVVSTVVRTAWTIIRTYFTAYFTVIKTIVTTGWKVISTVFTTAWTVIRAVVVNAWNGIREFFMTSLNAFRMVFEGPWNAISDFLFNLWNTIRATLMMAWTAIRGEVGAQVTYLRTLIEIAWGAIRGATAAAWNAIRSVFATVWGAIRSVVTTYVNAVRSVVTTVWNTLRNVTRTVWNAIRTAISNVWNTIRNAVSTAVNAVRNVVSNAWNAIKSATSNTWNTIKGAISGAWDTIKGLVSGATSAVRSTMDGAWNTIKGAASSAWTAIKTTVSDAWTKVKTAVTTGVSKAVTEVGKLPQKAKDALGDLGGFLLASGTALIQGFIDGITKGFDKAKGVVEGGLKKLRNLFPFSPAKEGPFSGTGYTTYSGRALMLDFAAGITDGTSSVVAAARTTMMTVAPEWKKYNLRATGQQIVGLLAHGIKSPASLAQVTAGFNHLDGKIDAALGKTSGKARKALKAKLQGIVDAAQAAFQVQAERWTELQRQIDAKIEEITQGGLDLKARVSDMIRALSDPTQISLEDGESLTFDKIIGNLQDSIAKAKEYAAVMARLKDLGLNNDTFMQLAEAGVGGLDAAKLIAEQGKAGVDELNKLQAELGQYAESAGETARKQYVENGMQAAKGFIEGLKSQQADIEKVMRDIGNSLVAQIKKALKIKSPSRVFRQLGGYTGEGFVLGVKDTQKDAEEAILGLAHARPKGIELNRAQMSGAQSQVNKTFIYNAAPGSAQLTGEESLFGAIGRARSNGF